MKVLKKKVVIATAVGLASMVLGAACGYGPPPIDLPQDDSSVETSDTNEDDNTNDNNMTDTDDNKNSADDNSGFWNSVDNNDDGYEIEPECVYGPPTAD